MEATLRSQPASIRPPPKLEVGKNADLVLWSGHPFSVYTRAEKVWIDGAMLYDRADATQEWRTDFELGYVPNAGGIR